MNDIHHHHMNHALRLARQGLGRVWPNPSVGCVIVKDGRVVGLGRTQDGGRPHAERVALDMAGAAAKGATAYVTLEPCNLERPGGCCSQALIDAGIQEVHIGQIDPNAHTNGGGVERLRAAGIQVHTGLCKAEAEDVHKGFISRITQGRPFVTLKTATSADGRIATENGSSQWITGAQARAYAHSLRAGHDAVLAGIGTVLADDPLLTARLPGLDKKTVRVVLDSHL
ncbi:MAG TPA: bifunctional diaminohydroxyphosphoribosylaminopyrimidine deaminase/5-amino-6-(5-phosphoribosylamino)uracil reductase RibD, partial [Alphaproteobacteria bacterium]|nr:bifunctional diaminohydroxyphosphoribosylaminopyrimidine deaminase/5-amino-6-(5-phosphoribosylamino)uracil reductase RibD [Alphaproteobacteria bacterium]